jgi:hypothetical protein
MVMTSHHDASKLKVTLAALPALVSSIVKRAQNEKAMNWQARSGREARTDPKCILLAGNTDASRGAKNNEI